MKQFVTVLSLLIFSLSTKAQITPANNKIGVDISTNAQNSAFNYDSCMKVGVDLGMSQLGLFQTWKAIETSSVNYNFTIFDIANLYYPAANMPIDLIITPINTNVMEVPSDLTLTPMSSTLMISRFNRLLDSIKVHIPNVTLSSLVIGSEYDVYFGNNATQWSDYTTFYNATMAHAKILWPGLKVATELTFNGITTHTAFAQTMNTNSDYIGVSYYPLNNDFTVKPISTIPVDFATLVGLFPVKKLCFYQYGYPSSTTCNSSDALQSQFITQTFQTWDVYKNNVRLIDFTWLHDLDPAQVNYLSTYYNVTDAVFLEYLRTLGIRTWGGNGTDKPALHELRCQAKARGYNTLPLACTFTGLNNPTKEDKFIVFPNPTSSTLYISSQNEIKIVEITNNLGQLVYSGSSADQINVSDLKNGIYFLKLTDKNSEISISKFIVAH